MLEKTYGVNIVMKYCTHCGAELLDEAVICPKCGCWADPLRRLTAQQNPKLNVCALIGFIFSLVSVIVFVNIIGLLALAALILSIVGLTQINRNNDRGKGLAIAGIVISACAFLFGMVIWMSIIG